MVIAISISQICQQVDAAETRESGRRMRWGKTCLFKPQGLDGSPKWTLTERSHAQIDLRQSGSRALENQYFKVYYIDVYQLQTQRNAATVEGCAFDDAPPQNNSIRASCEPAQFTYISNYLNNISDLPIKSQFIFFIFFTYKKLSDFIFDSRTYN
jgi:hypothetical protein